MIGKFLLKARKIVALATLAEKAAGMYNEIRHGKPKFFDKIDGYRVQRPDGTQYSLGEMATHHGLEAELQNYKQALEQKVGDYLIRLKNLVDYLKNLGQIADPKKEDYQVNAYVAVKSALNELSKLAGYMPRIRIGRYNYLTDLSTKYMGGIGDINKKFERLLELGSGLGSKGSRLVYEGFNRTRTHLTRLALEKKGIPFAGLEGILSAQGEQPDAIRRAAKTRFEEYGKLAKSIRASYGADLESGIYLAAA